MKLNVNKLNLICDVLLFLLVSQLNYSKTPSMSSYDPWKTTVCFALLLFTFPLLPFTLCLFSLFLPPSIHFFFWSLQRDQWVCPLSLFLNCASNAVLRFPQRDQFLCPFSFFLSTVSFVVISPPSQLHCLKVLATWPEGLSIVIVSATFHPHHLTIVVRWTAPV